MDNKSDEQLIIIQSKVESNKQETDEKLTHIIENFKVMIEFMMDQTNNSKLSSSQKDTSNTLDPNTLFPYNRRAPQLDDVNSTKYGVMWTLKHEIRSPKFYELLIKTELKKDTALNLNNFYNHIKMCVNAVTRL